MSNSGQHYEGLRYYRLVSALNHLVGKICSLCNWESFISCFPPDIVRENKEALYIAYSNAFKLFRESILVCDNDF